METLKTGKSAYYDTLFHGLIPCKVLAISFQDATFSLATFPGVSTKFKVKIELTEDRGAYKKGEIMNLSANDVVPRKSVRHRIYGTYIQMYDVEVDK